MRVQRSLDASRPIAKALEGAGFVLVLLLAWQLSASPAYGQLSGSQQFLNNFTDDGIVPKGCLFVLPSAFPTSPSVFYDESYSVTNDNGHQGDIRIRAWREGCHEAGRSALVVNIEPLDFPTAQYPREIYFDSQMLDEPEPMSFGFLPKQSAWSASKNRRVIVEHLLDGFDHGVSLVVDGLADNVPVETYNSTGGLIVDFGNNQGIEIPVPAYDPELDPPQFERPPLNGRFSGQWAAGGLPNTGLVLQVAEVSSDANVASVIWFTYKDGEPTWFVANTSFQLGAAELTFELLELQGGQVLTAPESFEPEDIDIDTVGTMVLRTVNCNVIEADVDLSSSDLGQQSLQLERLVSIAGYDCNQT